MKKIFTAESFSAEFEKNKYNFEETYKDKRIRINRLVLNRVGLQDDDITFSAETYDNAYWLTMNKFNSNKELVVSQTIYIEEVYCRYYMHHRLNEAIILEKLNFLKRSQNRHDFYQTKK